MSIFKKIGNLHETVHEATDKVVTGTVGEFRAWFDRDHRHDEAHEKERDAKLMAIRDSHRFRSFADENDGNMVKWHIDGHDFFWAVSELLDRAKHSIFICDWWLSPEIFLRRPPEQYTEWRLDRLLERKAKEGVKIHVIVYKEVTVTMSMSSKHTKDALHNLHPNIAVMRHPDHVGSVDSTLYWSHHEKIVVVDNMYASIGGLDLCFGRWDTHTHPMADAHPTQHDRTLFAGQDYNNARVLDFQQVDHYVSNQLSVLDTGRMPWHDVHMTLMGPSVLDIAQHFVERWNEIKKRKYADNIRYEWLQLPEAPQQPPDIVPQPIELEDTTEEPKEIEKPHEREESWHEWGHRHKQKLMQGGEKAGFWGQRKKRTLQPPRVEDRKRDVLTASCRVQVVRSVSDWSHGVLTEDSVHAAYCQMIMEASHFIYIENQFFISNTKKGGSVQNQIAAALVQRILKAARAGEKFKVIVVIPEVPGFAGDIKQTSAILTIMGAQWRTINRGGNSIMEAIRSAGFDPSHYIKFYHLRSYDRINAPYESFIKGMEEKSGVTFHAAQIALARKWIGKVDEDWVSPEAAIAEPQKAKEGVVQAGTTKTVEQIKYPETEQEADEIIRRFEAAASRADDQVSGSVAQHAMKDTTTLLQEKWLGTEAEERACYVTELLYIHSKVMIVDDRRVIMGSANINDRSQKGDGDSEIALVVEDMDTFECTMDGKPYMASRFAATLRRSLFKEHLGLMGPQWCKPGKKTITSYMTAVPAPHLNTLDKPEDLLVADPLSDEFDELWNGTARRNTQIFGEVFKTIPSNNVRNWKQYEAYVPKVKAGHVAGDIGLDQLKERLSKVRGHLVESALDFLIEEDDIVTGPEWWKLNLTLPIYI